MKTPLLISLIICLFFKLSAQIDSSSLPIIEKLIDGVENLETISEEYEMSEDQENVVWKSHNKWNINLLNSEVALQIFEMSDFQYYQLQKYIDQQGELLTIYELAGIEGFSYEEIQKWIPYLDVKPVKKNKNYWNHFFKFGKHQLLIRNGRLLEQDLELDDRVIDSTKGSNDHLCFKYQFKTNDWFSLSFSGEKDKEELLTWNKDQKGFDFYSGNMQFYNIGIIKK